MTEKLLQFIWQFGYYNQNNLATAEGEKLTIIFPGTLNQNSGPDFLAAKICIGQTTFFGSIELHLQTSDWERHKHQQDANYSNVILHVVYQHNKELANAIPVLELEPRISTLMLQRYHSLMQEESFVACGTGIATVKELTWVAWKERLLVERLTQKAEGILLRLQENKGHWEETFWWLLARSFGMKVNADAFEAVARSVSVTVLAKHKSSIHQVEALLFGQAGLLEDEFNDDYPMLLQREYRFLQKKLSLKPTAIPLQFLRMRPGNFPTIRLAQLAVLVHQSLHLFSKILQTESSAEVKPLFAVTANDFWHYHYTFRQASPFKKKSLGINSVENILVNTVVPALFAYGLHHNEEKYKDKALAWLENIAAEKNNITDGFLKLGIKSKNAFDTQALIHLNKAYCQPHGCLSCAIGNSLLKKEVLQEVANNLRMPQ